VEHEAIARLAAQLVELQPVLKNSVRLRCATCAIARPDAELISPMMTATLSRSINRSALVDAVCGLTLSSAISSILRPMTPPAASISSTASVTPITAYSPSGPRNPVRGVRCPNRMASDWPLTMAGNPSVESAVAAHPLQQIATTTADRRTVHDSS
jgi:hypothetical protein